jgi:hypothetical protein
MSGVVDMRQNKRGKGEKRQEREIFFFEGKGGGAGRQSRRERAMRERRQERVERASERTWEREREKMRVYRGVYSEGSI